MDSVVEATIKRFSAELTKTRTTEQTEPFEIRINFSNKEAAEFNKPPIIRWLTPGGRIVPPHNTQSGGIDAIGMLDRAECSVRLWMNDRGELERLMHQMVLTSRLLDRGTLIDFSKMMYRFPSNVEGRWGEFGQCIDMENVGVLVPVLALPDGSRAEVVIATTQQRSGIENPPGEPPAESEYAYNEWSDET